MLPYTPAAWYWIVAGDTAQVWSSASAAYVPATDSTYQAWLAEGHTATVIASEAELYDVLAQACPAGIGTGLTAPGPAQSYARRVAAGCQIVSAGTPALSATYSIDDTSLGRLSRVSLYVQANAKFPGGAASFVWWDKAGGQHVFSTTAAFQSFATAIGDYDAALVQALLTAEAGGTAAWPSQPVEIA